MKVRVPAAKNNVHDYPGRVQPVVAVWPNGKVAGFFDSIKAAVDKYGFSRDGIALCCRGRQRLCGGFNWFYERDFKPLFYGQDAEALKTPPNEERNNDGTFRKGHHINKGQKRRMTPELLQKCRVQMKRMHTQGILKHDPSRNWKAVVEIETGKVYPSIGHAAKATGYTYSGMASLLRSPRRARKTGKHYCLKSVWDRISNKKCI